jgi:hypothetical protein
MLGRQHRAAAEQHQRSQTEDDEEQPEEEHGARIMPCAQRSLPRRERLSIAKKLKQRSHGKGAPDVRESERSKEAEPSQAIAAAITTTPAMSSAEQPRDRSR